MRWILNNIVIQADMYVIFGTILGSVLYLLWKMVGQWSEKKVNVDISYFIWKMILLSFWCPISFFVLLRIRKIGLYGFDFWQTNEIMIVAVVLFVIWMIGLIRSVSKCLSWHKKIHISLKQYGNKESRFENEIEKIRKQLKVHRKVEVLTLDFIEIPMVYGLFCPKILLPPKEYDLQELEVILLHEFVHHKHHDLFWKQLFQITRCIYWFHPVMKDILRQLDQWGETACDMTVSRYIKSVKEYFSIILTMAVEQSECDVYMSGLCEESKILMLRMQRMNAYMQKKPLKKVISASVILLIFGISTVTVMASSVGVAKGYGYIVDKTEENDDKRIIDQPMPDLQEKEKKYEKDNSTRIKFNEKMPKVGDVISFGYDLKSGDRIESQKTYIRKGTVIELSVTSGVKEDGDSKDIEAGIMDMKGNERYVKDNWDLWHYFKIKQSGYYKIYVENYGDRMIDMAGLCSLKKEEEVDEENN